MNGFIYAVDNVDAITDAQLAERGMGHVRGPVRTCTSTIGPGQKRCLLVADGKSDHKLQFVGAAQRWARSLNDQFWIGLWTDAPPTSASLARSQQTDGHAIDLEDGCRWQIPCARVYGGGTKLPSVLKMTADGMTATVKPEFVEFCDRAQKLWDFQLSLIADGRVPDDWSFEDQWTLCAEALTINYHVGTDEINALGLFSSRNLNDIGAAVVDMPTVKDLMEKRLSDEKKKTRPSDDGD